MTKANLVLLLFAVAAACFVGAWWIAVQGPFLGSANFNAYLAAGGVLATTAFFVERLR